MHAQTFAVWCCVESPRTKSGLGVCALTASHVHLPRCRRDLILASETSEEVAELLQDLGQLRVVPLLQALLFDA